MPTRPRTGSAVAPSDTSGLSVPIDINTRADTARARLAVARKPPAAAWLTMPSCASAPIPSPRA
ncbi:hypothetical protein [Lysobacter gummosus]|uniref:hypothetical protein n=1 Tax=Lysobacter gummosus TaxID=262324 RepID=UPI003641A860